MPPYIRYKATVMPKHTTAFSLGIFFRFSLKLKITEVGYQKVRYFFMTGPEKSVSELLAQKVPGTFFPGLTIPSVYQTHPMDLKTCFQPSYYHQIGRNRLNAYTKQISESSQVRYFVLLPLNLITHHEDTA